MKRENLLAILQIKPTSYANINKRQNSKRNVKSKISPFSNLLNDSVNKQSQKLMKNNVASDVKNSEMVKNKLMMIQFMDQPYKLAINNRFMSHRKTYSHTKKHLKSSSNQSNRVYQHEPFNIFLDDNIEHTFRVVPPRLLFTPCQANAVRIQPKPIFSLNTSKSKILTVSSMEKKKDNKIPSKQNIRYKMSSSCLSKKMKNDSNVEPWISKNYESINF